MGLYLIDFTETAIKDLHHHKKVGNKATMWKIDASVNDWRSIQNRVLENLNNLDEI